MKSVLSIVPTGLLLIVVNLASLSMLGFYEGHVCAQPSSKQPFGIRSLSGMK